MQIKKYFIGINLTIILVSNIGCGNISNSNNMKTGSESSETESLSPKLGSGLEKDIEIIDLVSGKKNSVLTKKANKYKKDTDSNEGCLQNCKTFFCFSRNCIRSFTSCFFW